MLIFTYRGSLLLAALHPLCSLSLSVPYPECSQAVSPSLHSLPTDLIWLCRLHACSLHLCLAHSSAQAGAQVGDARFCLEAAWNNGACEAGCNNLECGYNECTTSQIVSACVPRQELAQIDYSVPPAAGQARSPSSIETATSARCFMLRLEGRIALPRGSFDLSHARAQDTPRSAAYTAVPYPPSA